MYVFECVTRFGLSRLALQRRNVFECETGLSLSPLLLLPSLHSLLNCSEVCLRKFSKRVLTFKLKPVSPFKLLVIEVGRGSSRNVLVLLYHYEQGGLIGCFLWKDFWLCILPYRYIRKIFDCSFCPRYIQNFVFCPKNIILISLRRKCYWSGETVLVTDIRAYYFWYCNPWCSNLWLKIEECAFFL